MFVILYFGSVLQRIVNNFYLRNLVACFLYVSPDLFQDIADIQRLGIIGLFKDVSGHICFYIYFIFHARVLYEKLFVSKKYFFYALAFMITMFAWRESSQYIIWLISKPSTETVYYIVELKQFNWLFWVFIYWADFIYSWIALGVYLAFKYFKERAALLEIENVRKELELRQLNEQLNPHFLFNALNNIYSHLLRGSGDGKELILKLSELMRYILDSNKRRTVTLNEELIFIEHYIAFEKERLGERCEVHYTKSHTAVNFNIVPLILFNFIENAFKHGTTSIHKSDIYISISANNTSLKLIVSNPVYPHPKLSTQTGLDNAMKRLSLIYPDAYRLEIKQDVHRYIVMLEILNIE